MSGIVGLFQRDNKPVERAILTQMLDAIAHRGPDGCGIWLAGAVGLGHQMLHSTPESLHEQLPYANRRRDLIISAHARIDNRAELITTLNLQDAMLSDSGIILAAYERWAEHCPEYLLGDFAFGIWNIRTQTLFCARDHFGVRPFYYYLSDRVFAFGSEIKVLAQLLPLQVNELRIADYLANMFGDAIHTFYKHVLRLPPGHSLLVSPQEARLHCYYALDPQREIRLSSNAEYAEAFRSIFIEAVHCRMRSAMPVGATLSGGLDSSSVVCVARELRTEYNEEQLHTFSLVYDRVAECDERCYIQSVLAGGDLQAHWITGDSYGMLHELDRLLWHLDEPFHGQGLASSWPLYAMAREQGVRVMLVGHDGDTSVSHGHGLLAELAYNGHWLTLAQEVRALLPRYPMPFWQAFGPLIWQHGIAPRLVQLPAPMALRKGWRNIRQRLNKQRVGISGHVRPATLLRQDFAQRIGFDAYRYQMYGQAQQHIPSERFEHYENLVGAIQPLALENLDKLGAAHQIDIRYPFWDRRLIEFCLALPGAQKLHQGWDRIVMRRAMQGFLPAQIQGRHDKMDFLPANLHSLRSHDHAILQELLLADSDILGELIHLNQVQAICHSILKAQQPISALEVVILWRVAVLAAWLRHNKAMLQSAPAAPILRTTSYHQAYA